MYYLKYKKHADSLAACIRYSMAATNAQPVQHLTKTIASCLSTKAFSFFESFPVAAPGLLKPHAATNTNCGAAENILP